MGFFSKFIPVSNDIWGLMYQILPSGRYIKLHQISNHLILCLKCSVALISSWWTVRALGTCVLRKIKRRTKKNWGGGVGTLVVVSRSLGTQHEFKNESNDRIHFNFPSNRLCFWWRTNQISYCIAFNCPSSNALITMASLCSANYRKL